MYTVVYVSRENQVMRLKPAFIKDQYTIPQKKRKLLGTRTDTNHPKSKVQVTRGCYNCTHELSKYYYWKPSPCNNCFRNPANSHWTLRADFSDNWERVPKPSFLGRNHLFEKE